MKYREFIKQISSVLFLLVVCLAMHAQYKPGSFANGIMPTVIPSSPEASSLGKYGDWPVSQYTGVPGINIPIYEVKVNGFELPVSLSYHAGGVKVDDVSGWVGSNWSLSAGGVISRTIVGRPDEEEGVGFLYFNQRNVFLKTSYNLSNQDDHIQLSQMARLDIDTEPDIYSFNFGGFSGRFYFDKTGKFQCIPVNSLKLIKSPVNNTLVMPTEAHWEIADASGNIYYFGSTGDGGNGIETSQMLQVPPSQQLELENITAWYLTKIIPANRADTIYLDYVHKSEAYNLPENHSLRMLTNSITQGYPPYSPPPGSRTWAEVLNLDVLLKNGTPNAAEHVNRMNVTGESVLNKIRWKQGELRFTASTGQQDMMSGLGKMLDAIAVYNKEGIKLKEFQLNYLFYNKRSFLNELVEKDITGTQQIKHSFQYYSPNLLPERRLSFAQDHWGFYNGASNNSLLPPDVSMNNPSLNANREPSDNYMQYGTLKRITYPTGGYTEFEYEPHRYDPSSPVNGGPPSQITNHSLNVKAGDPQPGGFSRTQTFSIGFAQNTIPINIQFTNYNKPPSKELAWLPSVKIERLLGGTYQQIHYWDAYENFPAGPVTPNQNGLIDFTINQLLNLDPGNYRIVTDLVCGVSDCGTPAVKPAVSADMTYSSYGGDLPMAGGLRIKQITNYNNGAFVNAKKYLYAPGKLLIYPRYVHKYSEDVFPRTDCYQDPGCPSICVTIFANYKEITSSSQSILGFTQGSPVGYGFVKEQNITSTGEDNGFTNYTFSFVPDVLNIFQFDPVNWDHVDINDACAPLNNYEYKRGLPELQEIYKKNEAGFYVKIHSLSHTYQFNDNNTTNRYNSLRALRVKKMRSVNYPCGTSYNGHILPDPSVFASDYAYSYYDLITSWVQKTSTTETTYDENGNNPSTATTNFTYTNPEHLQLTGSSTTDSKGNIISTANKYPEDYPNLTATDNLTLGIKLLQQRYIRDKAIESSSYIKKGAAAALLTGATFTSYRPSEPYPDKVMKIENEITLNNFIASSVQSGAIVSDSKYKNQATFDIYDSYGNILQLHKENEPPISYIWDYQSSFPIAEIKNAAVAATAYTSFESNSSGNWTIASATRDILTIPLTGKRSYNLSSGTISKSGLTTTNTYIVSYWTKNTSALTIAGTQGIPFTGKTINGWKYFEHTVTGQSTITLSGAGLIDELRLYPKGAFMKTFTYDPLVGVTGMCDDNNVAVYYEYDSYHRLTVIRDQDGKVAKRICYNYHGQPENCSYYYNTQKSQAFIKDNCPSGQLGTSMNYVVNTGTYSSTISQADADQKALNDVAANGQAYANANGACTPIIYAELRYENIQTLFGVTTGDIVVRFFSNAALTTPVSVTNLSLNWKETVATGSTFNEYFNVSTATGTSKVLLSGTTLYNSSTSTARNYYLTAGAGYIFINSGPGGGGGPEL